MITKSIRWRLQFWLAFLLVCILSGFGLTAYQLHRTNEFHQIDQELERRVEALASALRGGPPFDAHGGPGRPPFGGKAGHGPFEDEMRHSPGPGPRRRPDFPMPRGFPEGRPGPGFREVRLSPQVLNLFDQGEKNSFYFAIWSREGSLLKSSTNSPAGITRPPREEAVPATHARMLGNFREAFYYTGLGECVLAGRSIVTDLEALHVFAGWLITAAAAVLALGLALGWLVTSRAIRPIDDIGATASRISAGNLAERISVTETDDELGRLAGVLNSTFARLEAAFAQQKQFTADASHELRTPIAVIISEAQTALARKRNADEYRETVEACLETAQQMRRLTESLLELARFDAGQADMQRQPFDLAEKTGSCIELVRPLAKGRGIVIHADLAPVEALGDAERLGQVVTNLLTNAIHYNIDHGEIRIATRSENGFAVVTVADSGQGIAPEDLPHIFSRFYRADKSRARSEGRTGLGLAICQAVVDAHGGVIEVSSQPGIGTTFCVRLPGVVS